MPRQTLEAYRDHGRPAPRLEDGLEEARQIHRQLAQLGIDLDAVTQQLEEEGIEKFNQPYDHSLETLRRKAAALREPVA